MFRIFVHKTFLAKLHILSLQSANSVGCK